LPGGLATFPQARSRGVFIFGSSAEFVGELTGSSSLFRGISEA
jgi:hypothetical protein